MANGFKRFEHESIKSKENIKRNIRHALSEKRNTPLLNVNTAAPAFFPSDDLTIDFVKNFRESGGIFVPCVKNDFAQRLTQLLIGKRYERIYSSNPSLNHVLERENIPFLKFVEPKEPADVALIYADYLIARWGALYFSNKYLLYPSVLNLAKDLIVIGMADGIIESLDVLHEKLDTDYEKSEYTFSEIIRPHHLGEGEEYSPQDPQLILFFIAQ
ncbi:MAG TPA: hypothetical protein PLH70_05215 [Bacteroidales bacterium]|nr:hypothetical protein [Bacteroidales bacterium]HOH23327.1 hypothetical protein [Bacteroidales bacterium]HPB57605.1 hypothetical protein [Bacteroidales bacterium]HPZ04380.1 hypothetical protein [Bacteroidales bacterium]HQB75182.1 hypothetical protein [Bacteroidales bacterium]